MKKILKHLLQYYLKFIAKIVLYIHRPLVIAVTGSTNKSFYKEEISRLLRERGFDVRSNIKSFNTEIGLPLAILSLPSGYGSYKEWIPAIIQAPRVIFNSKFPKILVLELGISQPNDMKFLLSIIKPDYIIITNITQRYIESFSGMDELSDEYEYLVKYSNPESSLLFNWDNSRVQQICTNSDKSKISFGFNEGADYQVLDYKQNSGKQIISIKSSGESTDYVINRPGKHHVYALIAALIVADKINLNMPGNHTS